MEHRGRPVAGAVAGFCFFGFLGMTLMLFGVFTIGGPWLGLAPIGAVVGAIWGWFAPLGRRRHRDRPPSVHVPADTSGATSPAWTVRPITGEVPIVPPPPPPPPVPPPPPTPIAGSPEVRPDGEASEGWPDTEPWPHPRPGE